MIFHITFAPLDCIHVYTDPFIGFICSDMTASSAAKCSIKHFNISPKTYSRFVVVKYIYLDFQKKKCTAKAYSPSHQPLEANKRTSIRLSSDGLRPQHRGL